MPYFSAAMSPARPWRYTAAAADENALAPCARIDAVIPASTSPLPPVAMPELPVGFTSTLPFGEAITVPAPLRTVTTPYF